MYKDWVVQRIGPRNLHETGTVSMDEWKRKEMQSLGRTDRELQDEFREAVSFFLSDSRRTSDLGAEGASSRPFDIPCANC